MDVIFHDSAIISVCTLSKSSLTIGCISNSGSERWRPAAVTSMNRFSCVSRLINALLNMVDRSIMTMSNMQFNLPTSNSKLEENTLNRIQLRWGLHETKTSTPQQCVLFTIFLFREYCCWIYTSLRWERT